MAWPFMMAPNVDRIAWDAEYDMWFKDHPFAPEFIFAPLRWLRHRLGGSR